MVELVASISTDARLEANYIDTQAQEEIARINAETAMLVTKKQELLASVARKQEEEALHRLEAKQQLETRERRLACKQALIDETFAAARKAIQQKTVRRKLLQRLWEKASKQIPVARVITTRIDALFFKGKKVAVTTTDGIGGFIAESADKKVRVDMRFETLLDDLRERKIAEISAVLFASAQVTR